MAFNTDKFREHVLNREKERAAKKGKGLKPWEMKEFRLGVDEQALCRFHDIPDVPGDEPGVMVEGDPYVRKYHWPEGMGPKSCTSEIALFGGKCCYCYYAEEHKAQEQKKFEEARARKEKYQKSGSRLNQQSRTIMAVTDFRFYHMVPGEKTDEKSVIACNVEGPDGDPERCEACADDDEGIKARIFGGGRRWELKDDHLSQVFAAHQRLQKICVAKLEDGSVCQKEAYVIELHCKSCGADLVDPDKVRRMSTKDQEAAARKEVACQDKDCGFKGTPELISACKSGAHAAVRGSIFDKSVRVLCSGEKKVGFNKVEYEDKVFTFDVTAEPFEGPEETLMAWGFEDKEIEKILAPIDFSWEFRPEFINPNEYKEGQDQEYVDAVLKAQAENLKLPNPWGTGPVGGFKGGGGARSFSRRT